jgi:gp16 family phage-associated protein
MKAKHRAKTGDEIRAEFERRGLAVSVWAREHGYHPKLVFEVIRDPRRGRRGQSHEIAVLLGLKEGVIEHHDHRKDAA